MPSSQAVQYEWPFCLVPLSSVRSGMHVWLAAPYKSIQPGTHNAHTCILYIDRLHILKIPKAAAKATKLLGPF